jgi:hypothetical protein
MNKQLRQFEKESKLEIFGLGARREIWEAALEKYAELIVKECASKVDYNLRDWLQDSNQTIGDKILEHFGVEE